MAAPRLTPALLAEPAQRAAREIARLRLEAVVATHARLGTDDPQALHDVRVALRRLRSWLKAYRPALDDTVTRKSRRASPGWRAPPTPRATPRWRWPGSRRSATCRRPRRADTANWWTG